MTAKRPGTVITHILVHGQITTEELKNLYGYNHPPRAARDVKEHGIPIEKTDANTRAVFAPNDSAVQAMGDAKLKVIAAELITQVKRSVTIDWTLRESARAKIKVMVKRNKHGYPPDLQVEAVKTFSNAGRVALRKLGIS